MQHYKFLGFQWTFEDGRTRFVFFNVLPFRLSFACYAFTKVFTSLLLHNGEVIFIYTDDSIAAFRTFEPTKSTAHLVRTNLISAGFVMSEDKSDFIPKAKEKWLSVTIDTINLIFTIP